MNGVDDRAVERHRTAIGPRAERLRERIDASGGHGVTVVAVTKGHPVEVAVAAAEFGFVDLGENYAQELVDKADLLETLGHDAVRWHFIGQLQTNKVRSLAGRVALWQSVDRSKVGREISKRAPGAEVLVQVNLSADDHKGGCSFGQLDQLVGELADLDLDVVGLMGVGVEGDVGATTIGFRRLRSAVDRLGLRQCSMGMSADLELAIAEGSTMVRVGSDLFGPRS
jgi:pyridoxal phosphate enzyme (YggS family)